MDEDDGGTPQGGAGMRTPSKRPTLGDVAASVGVSKALVSLVLRDAPGPGAQTRARVLEAAAALGYRSNRTASLLARRRTRLLGVMMSVRSTFHAELVENIQAEADECGYEVVLSALTRTHDERRAVDTLLEFRCEGLVLLGPEASSAGLDALGEQLPVAVVGRRDSAHVDVVRTADDVGVRQAVEHLVELGHREIVHVDGGKGTIAADRRRGYRQAMRRNGLVECARVITGDYTEEAGVRVARRLLGEGRLPTAVVAVNDRCAIGLLDTFVRAGIEVPAHVSVVGYDDSMLARLAHVDLTTVSQEAAHQAHRAVTAVVERLEGEQRPREWVLTPRLIRRSTTAPPEGSGHPSHPAP